MPGRGRPPKDKAERLNFSAPRRGEWIDLPSENPGSVPVEPAEPRGGWAAGTTLAWNAWWKDPVSLVWSPADVELVRQLAYLHHDLERMEETRGKSSLAAEIRQRMDGLGLSQKGKRDLRLRIVGDEVNQQRSSTPPTSRYGHLRAVAGDVAGA